MRKEDFWDLNHQNKDLYWLTGTELREIESRHEIDFNFLKGKDFLEIGTGVGGLSYAIPDGINHFCCDISEHALNKVSNNVKLKFLSSEIKKIPPVDVAVCHLVFQHCDNKEVFRIIEETNLKNSGFMSIQFAFLVDPSGVNILNEIEQNNLFFRSLEKFQSIVDKTNKQIITTSPPIYFSGRLGFVGWHIARLINK